MTLTEANLRVPILALGHFRALRKYFYFTTKGGAGFQRCAPDIFLEQVSNLDSQDLGYKSLFGGVEEQEDRRGFSGEYGAREKSVF